MDSLCSNDNVYEKQEAGRLTLSQYCTAFFTFTRNPAEIDASAAPGTPEPPRPAAKPGGGGSILTKGKWLKITRKGLLVTAMSRIGKEQSRAERIDRGMNEGR